MKTSCFIFFLLFLNFLHACSNKGVQYSLLEVVSVKENKSLDTNQVQFIFNFNFADLDEINPENDVINLSYSVDRGPTETLILNEMKTADLILKPGKHSFIFYRNGYEELFSKEIISLAQQTITCNANFAIQRYRDVQVEKPVIYLYPKDSLNCTVSIKPTGELIYTYPQSNGVWNVQACPNGDIIVDSNSYNYLFWESSQEITYSSLLMYKSTIVSGRKTSTYIENYISKLGFTSKEKSDFMTYWGPRLACDDNWEITFLLNEEADLFGKLNVKPEPENLYRVYILARKTDQTPSENQAISVDKMNRSGFMVLEWGGSILPKEIISN